MRDILALGLPVFVKPARLGSSVGIVKVRAADELDAALDVAFAHDPLVIVEAFCAGMEVECAVIGLDEAEASVPGEVVLLKGAEWYDYEAKYSDGGVELQVPPRISDAAAAEVRRLAAETFLRVGCAGLARVDFFVEDGGRVLVNELNTMPGLTPTRRSRSSGRRPACPGRRPATACWRSRSSATAPSAARTRSECSADQDSRRAVERQLRDRDLVLAPAAAP